MVHSTAQGNYWIRTYSQRSANSLTQGTQHRYSKFRSTLMVATKYLWKTAEPVAKLIPAIIYCHLWKSQGRTMQWQILSSKGGRVGGAQLFPSNQTEENLLVCHLSLLRFHEPISFTSSSEDILKNQWLKNESTLFMFYSVLLYFTFYQLLRLGWLRWYGCVRGAGWNKLSPVQKTLMGISPSVVT